jgi:hypothetical protein
MMRSSAGVKVVRLEALEKTNSKELLVKIK